MGHPSSQVSELIVDSEMATGANVVGEWLSVSVFTRRDTIGRWGSLSLPIVPSSTSLGRVSADAAIRV